jgi:hypothetical protein
MVSYIDRRFNFRFCIPLLISISRKVFLFNIFCIKAFHIFSVAGVSQVLSQCLLSLKFWTS